MADSTAQPKSKETAKAAEAFAHYVALGPSRSLRKLAADYVRQNRYKTATTALRILQDWSVNFKWQDRIITAMTEEADKKLEEAAALDADTSLKTSIELNKRAEYIDAMKMDELIRMRETVRKPMLKGNSTSVSVGVNITITQEQREIAERIAATRGVPADDVIAEIESFLRGEKV
jgi:hypothetical protein